MKTKIIANNQEHLQLLIKEEIKVNGEKCDLNHIDTSLVTDMNSMFAHSHFNGDISKWDVSNVTNMTYMFIMCPFNGDISKWNVSNVIDMTSMFWCARFNGDITNWDISKTQHMVSMFADSRFTGDISNWDVQHVVSLRYIFKNCNVEKPWWAIDDNEDRKFMLKKYKLMKKLDDKLVSKEQISRQRKVKI